MVFFILLSSGLWCKCTVGQNNWSAQYLHRYSILVSMFAVCVLDTDTLTVGFCHGRLRSRHLIVPLKYLCKNHEKHFVMISTIHVTLHKVFSR